MARHAASLAMKKDYFAILGLKPSATDKEIRSAYKRLAKKHHPDVNPGNRKAEEKFKEIGEAYEVLSDPEKRRRWEGGETDFESFFRGAGARPGGGPGGGAHTDFAFGDIGDFGGIFEDLLRGMGGGRSGAARGAGARARRPSAGADLQYQASIGFEEAVLGTTLRIPLARTMTCPACRGEGTLRRSGGAGRTTREVCSTCGGAGRQRSNENIQVRIPPGVSDGGKVRVPAKGEAGEAGGPPGDLFVLLEVRPHAWFRREGREIVMDLPLTVAEAALGTRIEVPTIEGKVKLTIPPGTSSGQRLRLKGRGIPARDGAPRGDQIVVAQIVLPRSLDPRSRELIEELDRLNPMKPRETAGW